MKLLKKEERVESGFFSSEVSTPKDPLALINWANERLPSMASILTDFRIFVEDALLREHFFSLTQMDFSALDSKEPAVAVKAGFVSAQIEQILPIVIIMGLGCIVNMER